MAKGRYKHDIPLDLRAPLPECAKSKPMAVPEPRPSPHESGCRCVRCHNAGVRYADYLHKKAMEEL